MYTSLSKEEKVIFTQYMEQLDRKAAILLLLSIPALSSQGKDKEQVVNLDGFSLEIRLGTSSMKIEASEIWKMLNPIPPSNLL